MNSDMNADFLFPDDWAAIENELARLGETLPITGDATRERILKTATRAYHRGRSIRHLQFASTIAVVFIAGVLLTGYYVSLIFENVEAIAYRTHAPTSVAVSSRDEAEVSQRARLLASFRQPDVWASVEASEAYRLYGLESIRAAFLK